jgi:peptidoglycan/xylan/chitin deacetylase (PgdA/CDA1 family)
MRENYCLFTNDVETTSIWHNTLRDETGLKVYKEGMPRLLDLYKAHNIKTTFFFTGHIARLFPDIVRMVQKDGHEVASHGLSHLKEHAFDSLGYKQQFAHLSGSKKILEDICGEEVISFRSPALRTNRFTPPALRDSGFLIDSSIASQRFDMMMSLGSLKKLGWMTAPRRPYKTSIRDLTKRGKGPVVEVPISAVFFPYIGTTMRVFPQISKLFRLLLSVESKCNGKPIVFLIHPNELINESDEDRIIKKRSRNILKAFVQDVARSKLKAKNLGQKAVKIYEDQLIFFKKRKFRFMTLRDYCKKSKLI